MIFFMRRVEALYPVLKFAAMGAAFMAATAAAVCYGLSAARINLWLAMALVLGFNLPQLYGKKTGNCRINGADFGVISVHFTGESLERVVVCGSYCHRIRSFGKTLN